MKSDEAAVARWEVIFGDGLPTARVNAANFHIIPKPDGSTEIKRFGPTVRYVVTCDLCEYYRPCRYNYEADSFRLRHLTSAHGHDVLKGTASLSLKGGH